jgi:menaquinone-9 beta-reductase
MYDVIVVGGGLAGCSSAIQLSKSGAKVLLLERGTYPAHKICGEFLSVEVSAMLFRLRVLGEVIGCGAVPISQVTVTGPPAAIWSSTLDGTALGISRFVLDKLLFDKASRSGADARTGVNVLNITGDLDLGFTVETTVGSFRTRMVIGSYGKKSGLDTKLRRQSSRTQGGYVGYKQHYRGTGPHQTVEVHTFDRGYCGVNTIENDTVNVCWLASRSLLRAHGGSRESIMSTMFCTNAHLAARMRSLEPIPGTLCAVGGVTLQQKSLTTNDILMIGDSAQMIAPFCGDGMGMALRTAEIVVPLCNQFLFGNLDRADVIDRYAATWRDEFNARLTIGKWLQAAALSPLPTELALTFLAKFPFAGEWLIGKTRGAGQPISKRQPSIVRPGPNASAMP